MTFDLDRFLMMREKYGRHGSWAVWADPSPDGKKSSGIPDLSIFEPRPGHPILSRLHCNYVLVGLNFSRPVTETSAPFANFHSGYARSRDFQLRKALQGTPVWGAWMTDVIKDHPEPKATKVMQDVRRGRIDVREQINKLKEELRDLGATAPVLVALGRSTDRILRQYLSKEGYQVVSVTHYSAPVRTADLRNQIIRLVEEFPIG